MTIGRLTGLFFIALVFLVGSLVPASAADSRKVSLTQPALLHGQQIPPGEYRLSWNLDPRRGALQLQLLAGRRVVASAPIHVVLLDDPAPYEAVVFTRNDNGERRLSELRFAGDREAIRVGAAIAKAESGDAAHSEAEAGKGSSTR